MSVGHWMFSSHLGAAKLGLGFALEGLFWLHVETHPCHSVDGQNLSLNELIDIYAQVQTGKSATTG